MRRERVSGGIEREERCIGGLRGRAFRSVRGIEGAIGGERGVGGEQQAMQRVFADPDGFAEGEAVGAGDVARFDVATEFAFEPVEFAEARRRGLTRVVGRLVRDDEGKRRRHRLMVELGKLREFHTAKNFF